MEGSPVECDAAFIILRMGRSNLQEAKNSMQKHMPILENCKGKVVGVTKEIELLDCKKGMWDCKLSCIVLEFPSVRDAIFWFRSAPDVKQPDWLGGIDVVVMPSKTAPGRPQYLLLMDAYVLGDYEFLKEYAPKFTNKHTDDGVSMRAVATSEGQKLRGMWDPNYTTIHFAPDKDSLMKLFYTDEFERIENRRRSVVCDMVLLHLTDLH